MNSLGWLLSPLRKVSVFGNAIDCYTPLNHNHTVEHCSTVEKWSPIEVAVFEGAITLYGKNFNMIQKYVSHLHLTICDYVTITIIIITPPGEDEDGTGGGRVLLRLEEDQPLQGVEEGIRPG